MHDGRTGVREAHLDRYARLLVEFGVGLRQRQQLFVVAGVVHDDLVMRVQEAAREVGVGRVHVSLIDPLEEARLIADGNPRLISWYHQRQRRLRADVLRTGGALVTLAGVEFPDYFSELAAEYPEGFARFVHGKIDTAAELQEKIVQPRHCPWVTAPGVTPVWAGQVFPDDAESDAYVRLAEVVFAATFADREDALELAAEHRCRLAARQQALDDLRITEIHVTGGGNDLRIGLSGAARWIGASQETVSGQRFHCNLPCEESFTTPDRRLTRGRLVASRPFRTAGGLLVEGLRLEFRDGRVVSLDAAAGKDGFAEWLEVDDGARHLGEVALVGQETPLARSGLFFDLALLDENAACHVALGDAYETALAGGEAMSPEQAVAVGCNRSRIHTDVMFGSPAVDVVASKTREGEVVLLEGGRWTDRFR